MIEAYTYVDISPRPQIYVPIESQIVVSRQTTDIIFTEGLFSCIGIAGINDLQDAAFCGHYPTSIDIDSSLRTLVGILRDFSPKSRKFRVALAGGERWREDSERLLHSIREFMDNERRLELEIVNDRTLQWTEKNIPNSGEAIGVSLVTGEFIHENF